MILLSLFLSFCCCITLRTSPYSNKLFFIKSNLPLKYSNRIQKLYDYDETFSDIVDNFDPGEDSQPYQDEGFQEKEPVRDHLDLSANSVTICGRIGFIAEPKRMRTGLVSTEWHKVMLYGIRNVDYVYSRARVGDKALVIGRLRYYQPQNLETNGVNRTKIAEVYVNSSRGGHTFILMPKISTNLDNNFISANQQIYPNNF
uniref:Single-strand binding protein family n=1 Tax=Theileria annulata TaxID=5874 RepID=A0A3B0N8U2_THEAN